MHKINFVAQFKLVISVHRSNLVKVDTPFKSANTSLILGIGNLYLESSIKRQIVTSTYVDWTTGLSLKLKLQELSIGYFLLAIRYFPLLSLALFRPCLWQHKESAALYSILILPLLDL